MDPGGAKRTFFGSLTGSLCLLNGLFYLRKTAQIVGYLYEARAFDYLEYDIRKDGEFTIVRCKSSRFLTHNRAPA